MSIEYSYPLRWFVIIAMLSVLFRASAEDTHLFAGCTEDDERIGKLAQSVKNPSARSESIQSRLIGEWKHLSLIPKASLEITPNSLTFRIDGSFAYRYEKKGKQKQKSVTGSYHVCHKGSPKKQPGKHPHVIIKNTHDQRVIPFLNVSIDYDNRTSKGRVLRFHDLNGKEYLFVRDKIASPQINGTSQSDEGGRAKLESRHAKKNEKRRTTDTALTRQIAGRLENEQLNDAERNKAILRLMKIGDTSCVPVLIDHVADSHKLVVRQNAIRALGKIGDEQAVPILASVFKDAATINVKDEGEDEAILRRNAVLALGDIGGASALSVLKKVATSGKEYQSVRELARITIRKLGKRE